MSVITTNPATGEKLAEYKLMSKEKVFTSAKRTVVAQKEWSEISSEERARCFLRLAEVLRENSEKWASLMTSEMGKTITAARAEIEKCAGLCEFICERGEEWLKEEQLEADGLKHRVIFDPLGVVLLIMPWNYPFWQPFKVAIPPMFAGNGIVLKHARNVTGSALAIEEAFALAGFPEGLFKTVVTGHDVIGELLDSDYIAAASLTGSVGAGSRIAARAGKNIKKMVLELGGSDPFIVLDDANVEKTSEAAVHARIMSNAGQVCISGKRMIVMREVADSFIEKFVEKMKTLKVGDPMNEETDVGPLVDARAVEEMEAFVKDAVTKGGEVKLGGSRVEGDGCYFPPTIIVNTLKEMNIVCQEVFGPIAPVIVVDSEKEAIEIANRMEFGLSATVWGSDLQRAERVARKIDAGSVFINSTSKTHPNLPVGGIKKSGYGRELSHYGIKEFCNIKTINVYEVKK